MKTLDQKRDIILAVMNTPNEKMTVEQLSEAVREIVDIMWPMPDAEPAPAVEPEPVPAVEPEPLVTITETLAVS